MLIALPAHLAAQTNVIVASDRVMTFVNVRSASTRHKLPKETVVDRYASTERVILRTDRDRANNNDHIVCMKAAGMELNCNYESR